VLRAAGIENATMLAIPLPAEDIVHQIIQVGEAAERRICPYQRG